MSITTKEAAASIRNGLKKLYGLTSRQVGVQCSASGADVRISIHDPSVDMKEVANLATPHEDLRWDDYAGEILSGGRAVRIEYSKKAINTFWAQHKTMIDRMLARKPARGVEEWTADPDCGMGLAWKDGHMLALYSPNGCLHWVSHVEGCEARTLAEALLVCWNRQSPGIDIFLAY